MTALSARNVEQPYSPAQLAMLVSRGQWDLAPHLARLNTLITEVAFSETSRFVIVSVPPRHGKSWLTSWYTPAWYLGMFPNRNVILTSFEADFAASWGRKARDTLTEHGPDLFGVTVRDDSHAANRWGIEGHTGGMVSVGVGGSLTGRGGNLILMDDPVKNWERAQSHSYRESQWEWYKGTLRTRLEPNGSILLVMTRWHEDDLGGKLLAHAREHPLADQWEEFVLPALAIAPPEADEGWRDELGRAHGQALWPERYDRTELESLRETLTPLVFDAEYQQQPSSPEGAMFNTNTWEVIDVPPAGLKWVRRWDMAATEKSSRNTDPDYTAGLLGARDAQGKTYLADGKHVRAESLEVENLIRNTAVLDAGQPWNTVQIRIPQDPGAAGKQMVGYYKRLVLPQYVLRSEPETGDKVQRAQMLASQQQAGNVVLVRGEGERSWIPEFIEEARTFPAGHDDYIDVAAGLYNELAGLTRKRASLLDI